MIPDQERIVLPEGGKWFEGHFPFQPILPGVAHLALLTQPLEGVSSLRLRAPLLPGEAIGLERDEEAGSGTLRFSISRDEELVSRGSVTLSTGADRVARAEPPTSPWPESAPDVSGWIPHAPPIRCVERLLDARDEGATCTVRLPDSGAFAEERGVPAYFSLEAAAQTTAVLEAWRRRSTRADDGPRVGYLVGARKARFSAPWLAAGSAGRVSVRLEGHAGPLAVYAFDLDLGGPVVATGAIQVWIPT